MPQLGIDTWPARRLQGMIDAVLHQRCTMMMWRGRQMRADALAAACSVPLGRPTAAPTAQKRQAAPAHVTLAGPPMPSRTWLTMSTALLPQPPPAPPTQAAPVSPGSLSQCCSDACTSGWTLLHSRIWPVVHCIHSLPPAAPCWQQVQSLGLVLALHPNAHMTCPVLTCCCSAMAMKPG